MSDTRDDPYLDIEAVRASTSLGQSTIYRKMKEKTFPIPFRLSPGRVGWKKSEIDDWNASRPRSRAA
jgi:prophage regulatory protein